jgi:hypothetical protein
VGPMENLVHERASASMFTRVRREAACVHALPGVYTHSHETVLRHVQQDRVLVKRQAKYKSRPPLASLVELCGKISRGKVLYLP